jgi:peptidoglycan-associated lipoprotein
MRTRFLLQTILLAVVISTSTTGCAWWRRHFGKKDQANAAGMAPLGSSSGVGMSDRPLMTDGNTQRGLFTPVYFDYDSARIKPNEMSKLDAVATAVRGNNKNLVVEGHTDERGTAEYNRALGERRAQAARAELIRLGVDANRITTISYGKERPAEMSHDDTAWSRNRRCEFVIVAQ